MCKASKEAKALKTCEVKVSGKPLEVKQVPAVHAGIHSQGVTVVMQSGVNDCVTCIRTGYGMMVTMPKELAQDLSLFVPNNAGKTVTLPARFVEAEHRGDEHAKYVDALDFGTEDVAILVNFDKRFADAGVTMVVDLAPGQKRKEDKRQVPVVAETIQPATTPFTMSPGATSVPANAAIVAVQAGAPRTFRTTKMTVGALSVLAMFVALTQGF